MKNYRITLRHDGGRVRITTNASDAETALAIVLKLETAPRSAVVKVEELTS